MENKFPERLTEALRERGLSQSEFARRVHLSADAINGYCLGKRRPSLDNFFIICKELGESMDYMTGLVD